jgi:hypothetical protein
MWVFFPPPHSGAHSEDVRVRLYSAAMPETMRDIGQVDELWCRQYRRRIEPISSWATLMTIECSTCSALIEVYPQDVPGEPSVGWSTRDEEFCKAPPLRRCPHARAEIKRQFPGSDI